MQFGSRMLIAAVLSIASWFVDVAVSVGAEAPFGIRVVDDATGRGVALVELVTVGNVRFVTDSAGWVAVREPDLLGRRVYFGVKSHGYEYAADGFGLRGTAFQLEPGGRAELKLRRINLAERLYRTTGSGIYLDSVLLSEQVPIREPLLSAGVVGCDSVMAAEYRGKIHWFWGDTQRNPYPLAANFHITGATTLLPKDGGLSPSVGMNFDYFTSQDGSVRPMAEMPGEGPTWTSAITVLKEPDGPERMYAAFIKVRNMLESYRWGFVVWNDETQKFDLLRTFEEKPRIFLEPQTHTFQRREDDGGEYIYFANPLPRTRVKAEPEAFLDPARYECWTCLQTGTLPSEGKLDRDANGRLRYAWRTNTPLLSPDDEAQLERSGSLRKHEASSALRDVDSDRRVNLHYGSVYWNDHRQRWILIMAERGGKSSFLGETWFAEADAPTGPWGYARKIVTHDRYTFYNPKHHPFLDVEGGRTIYFEGTYTQTFSGNETATPRYDYNQIMYRLDLTRPELNLPVAVTRRGAETSAGPFVIKGESADVAFFALERPTDRSVSVIWKNDRLLTDPEAATALFHALPAVLDEMPPHVVPLWEHIHAESGQRVYSTAREWPHPGYHRSERPVCHVWRNPCE